MGSMHKGGKVLVVDDVRTDRLILGRLLENLGYSVEQATDGWEALRKTQEDSTFDLMMLDLSMPEMDGLEVLRQLREHPATAALPVIVMSSTDRSTLAAQSLELGAEDFISKPVDAPILRVRVRAALERRRLRDIQHHQIQQMQQMRDHLEKRNQELKSVNARLQQFAFSDGLTGLPNRRSMMDTLTHLWALHERSGRALCCILLDIDHFKRVNDIHGHDAGDYVLKQVASRLGEVVRAGDVVGRYGGEEFLILCPDTDAEGGRQLAERVRRGLEELPLEYRDFREKVTASFGVSEASGASGSKDELIKNADVALYEAKAEGRNRVVVSRGGAGEASLGVSGAVRATEPPARSAQAPPKAAEGSVLADAGRLRVLQESGLLDSAAEETFDRFTRLAARILNAPVSLLSLVSDDRQFFKSAVGLAEPWLSRRQTPLSHSFCQHIVESGAPLQVDEARKHPLVKDNLAIPELGVEAYLGVPVIVDEGQALGAFCVVDTTPRQWTEQEMTVLRDLGAAASAEIELRLSLARQQQLAVAFREAKDAAEAANAAKSEFLSSASHELRTPLNGIIGMCELVRGTSLTEEQREYVSMLRLSADSLLELVNDILDLAKIEAGHFELRPEDFALRDFLGEQLKPLGLKAATEGLRLVLDVEPQVPEWIHADSGRLRQILVNLVGNALKFTSEGSVLVHVSSAVAGELKFVVKDTGMGIPADRLATIFEEFTQVQSEATRHITGTGLGLTIVRRLVGFMGGEISCESELGSGSAFTFTIEAEPVDRKLEPIIPPGRAVLAWVSDQQHAAALQHMLAAGAGGGKYLVTQDRAVLLDSLRQHERSCVMVAVDKDEAAALSLLSEVRQTALQDYRLLALCPPGWEFSPAWQLRGMRQRVSWPLQASELREALQQAVQSPNSPTSPAGPTGPALRVLVLEDNRVNQKVIRAMLERMGHLATVTDDGNVALDLVKASSFDLALVDIQMPEMDGFEFTARVRECETGRDLHVVALTAQAMSGDRERCLEAGMDAYLPKPITLTALQDVLGKI